MGKAIGYVRVSTVQQATEGVSLDAQERRIRAWCEAQGLVLEKVFVYAGMNGSHAHNRPERQCPGCLRTLEAGGLSFIVKSGWPASSAN